jgi:hypothetical protein
MVDRKFYYKSSSANPGRELATFSKNPPSTAQFPKFSQLPAETRLMIIRIATNDESPKTAG